VLDENAQGDIDQRTKSKLASSNRDGIPISDHICVRAAITFFMCEPNLRAASPRPLWTKISTGCQCDWIGSWEVWFL